MLELEIQVAQDRVPNFTQELYLTRSHVDPNDNSSGFCGEVPQDAMHLFRSAVPGVSAIKHFLSSLLPLHNMLECLIPSNRTEYSKDQYTKTTFLICHRYVIGTGVEKMNNT
jgi:hypothetical protein